MHSPRIKLPTILQRLIGKAAVHHVSNSTHSLTISPLPTLKQSTLQSLAINLVNTHLLHTTTTAPGITHISTIQQARCQHTTHTLPTRMPCLLRNLWIRTGIMGHLTHKATAGIKPTVLHMLATRYRCRNTFSSTRIFIHTEKGQLLVTQLKSEAFCNSFKDHQ